MRISKILVAALFASLLTQPAAAQGRRTDVSNLAALCQKTTCHRAVNASIRNMIRQSDTEDDFNSRLGDLAAALFETARDVDDLRTRRRISTAIARLARHSSDREQKKSLMWVARQIRRGDGSLFDLDDPFAVSPS